MATRCAKKLPGGSFKITMPRTELTEHDDTNATQIRCKMHNNRRGSTNEEDNS